MSRKIVGVTVGTSMNPQTMVEKTELAKEVAHYITPEMFGAKGDGTSDDSVAIQTAIDEAGSTGVVYLANKTYKTTQELVFTVEYSQFHCDGHIDYSGNGSAIRIKGSRMKLYINKITATNGKGVFLDASEKSVLNTDVTINHILDSIIGIHLCSNSEKTTCISYVQIKSSYIKATDICCFAECVTNWLTENRFYFNSLTHANIGMKISGDGSGSNRILSAVFEDLNSNGCAIHLENTTYNSFQNVRCSENFGKNNVVFVGKCIQNDIFLSSACLGMIDISNLTSGSATNVIRGRILTGNSSDIGYSGGDIAFINYDTGITYNPIFANVSIEVNSSTFVNKVIQQMTSNRTCVIPTSLYFPNAMTNETYTLGNVYSRYMSLAKGFPLTLKFSSAGGRILLKDMRGSTVLDNTGGKYAGKTVSVRWNGYDKFGSAQLWDVQVLGETIASEEYVKNYAQAKGNYLTSIPSEYVTDSELNAKGYLTQHQDLSAYAKKTDIPSVPTKTSQLTNDSGFLTQHQSLSGYAKTSEHYTKTESDNKYQPKGNYLTSHQDISGKADKSSAETWTFTLANGSTVTKKVVLA